jgi:hypothetical protein
MALLHRFPISIICVLLIAIGGLVSVRASVLQQPVTPPEMTPLFATRLVVTEPGQVTVSAATLTLSPGATTIPVQTHGALLLLVEIGEIAVVSDFPLVGASRLVDADSLDDLPVYRLAVGERVTVPPMTRLRLIGTGAEAARVFLFTITPATHPEPDVAPGRVALPSTATDLSDEPAAVSIG